MKDVWVVDIVFTIEKNELRVLLPENRLPKERLSPHADLDAQAQSIFTQSTGIITNDLFFEQLYSYSKEEGITVAYYVLVPYHALTSGHTSEWVGSIEVSARHPDYDVIDYAVQRLRWKIEYTNAIFSLLPQEFTLGELQKAYEVVLGRALDKRNFRRKILSLGLLKPAGKKRQGIAARPAEIYSFKTRTPVLVNVFS